MRLTRIVLIHFASVANSNIPSSQILPPLGYSEVVLGSTGFTASTPLPVTGLGFVGAPSSASLGGAETSGISLPSSVQYSAAASGTSLSLTAQAVANNLNLQQCAQQVQLVNQQYSDFNTSMTGLDSQVHGAQHTLAGIDIVAHNILVEQANFQSEIDRLNVLYNTLSVRANALGKWMSDEKGVRDSLEELYRQMYAKTGDEDNRLSVMQTNVASALSKLAAVQQQTAGVLNDIATAQTSMYDWAVNVTLAVNTHTTKLNSVRSILSQTIAFAPS